MFKLALEAQCSVRRQIGDQAVQFFGGETRFFYSRKKESGKNCAAIHVNTRDFVTDLSILEKLFLAGCVPKKLARPFVFFSSSSFVCVFS